MSRLCKILLVSVLVNIVCMCFIYKTLISSTMEALVESKYNIPRVVLPQNNLPPQKPRRSDGYGQRNKQEKSKAEIRKSLKKELSKDMQKCSLEMGMSPDTVNQSLDKINRIAEKAAFFLDTFWEVVPKPQDFLPDYKNPCFYSNAFISKKIANYYINALPAYQNLELPSDIVDWLNAEVYEKQRPRPTLHCLPYFILPGFMKSGTTTLHSALSQHPQIAQPERKEPQWWYKVPLNKDREYLKAFIGRYLSNFREPSKQIRRKKDGHMYVTYDASQTLTLNVYNSSFHMDHEDYCALPAVISRVLPNAKIIVLMRDPVPRAFSHYLQMHTDGNPNFWSQEMRADPAQYFHEHITIALADWDECVKKQSLYECTNSIQTNYKELKVWLGSGIYHLHILKWMQFWPPENFLLLKMEDMSLYPESTMKSITDFLDLENISDDKASDWINRRQNRRKVNTSMLDEDTRLLKTFYEPFNREMDKLFKIKWTYSN